MSKRWYILLCLLFLLISPQTLLAATAALSIGTVNGTEGQSATVNLDIATGGEQVGGLELKVAFDPNSFSALPTVTQGAAVTSGLTFTKNVSSTGLITIVVYDPNAEGVVVTDGTIAAITFPVKTGVSGTLPITFSSEPLVSSPLGAAISKTYTDGGITIPDTAAPTVGTFTIASTSTTASVPITAFTATDNVAVTGYLVTESATAPAPGATGWASAAPSSYNVTASLTAGVATNVTLYGWAKDAAGNVSAVKSAVVAITPPDTTRPTVTGVTIPATATSLTVSVTGFTATDNVAVTGYLLTETSGLPAASATGWTTTAPTTFTFTSGGARTLYAWAKDAAGNVSLSMDATITITLPDSQAPAVSAFTVAESGTSLAVAVTGFTATDNIAVAGYLITESATAPAGSAAGWSTAAPTSYTVTGTVPQGVATSVTLYGWAKDAAGNVSAAVSDVVTLTLADTTKPVVDTFTVPATADTATVTVTLAASDNLAVTGYLITESATEPAASATGWTSTAPTSYSFSGLPQGTSNVTLYAWAKDAAGNVSAANSTAVSVTLTGPSLTLTNMLTDGAVTKNPALNVAGTVDGNGTELTGLTLSVNGATAEPLTFDATTGAFSTAVTLIEGANTIVIVATDANTNETTDSRTITLNPNAADLDVTAPVTGSFVTGSLVDVTGTVGSPQTTEVTIALNGGTAQNVDLNGGNSFVYQLNLAEGPNTIAVTADDSATGPHNQTINVTYDPTAPELTVDAPADAFATAKSNVVLSGTMADLLTTPTLTVKVDGVDIATQPTVTDGAFSTTIDLPTVKTYAISVTATDQSGNSSTVTRNVIRKDPSGNATDGISAPTLADVQKVLQFALGLATPTTDEVINVDVAPLQNGKPAPDGEVDGGDALVILEKIVGQVSWQ